MTAIVERNTTIPTRQSQKFTTHLSVTSDGIVVGLVKCQESISEEQEDKPSAGPTNLSNIVIKVYEGEGNSAQENYLLGSFELTDIPLTLDGAHHIEITFFIDILGTLQVSVLHKMSEREAHMTITNDRGHLSRCELERLIADAENDSNEN